MLAIDNGRNSALSHHHLSLVVTQMTKLFFEGIDPASQQDMVTGSCNGDRFAASGKITKVPVYEWVCGTRDGLPEQRQSSEFVKSTLPNIHHRPDSHTSVRWFVRNLSNEFNNILMGVLGNVTLVGMECSKHDVLASHVGRIERLITSAANLTHLLFGYLSERRIPAKKLQLVQLLSAIDNSINSDDRRKAFAGIKKCMLAISPLHDSATVAAAMAGVIEQMLLWIKKQLEDIQAVRHIKPKTARRLSLLGDLIENGFLLAYQLRLYSGYDKPVIKRVSLRSLLKQHACKLEPDCGTIRTTCDLPKSLPWIFADRKKIEFVLKAVSDNAISAMPGGGLLQISARMLYDEDPSERCGVHSGDDYVVISVRDTGCGMDLETQARIFEPFFRKSPQQRRQFGMGLCAASGIAKSHGGYIQVRSKLTKGSTFKIYLPIRQAPRITIPNLMEQEFGYAA